MRGKYFSKKSSCVVYPASFILRLSSFLCLYHCVSKHITPVFEKSATEFKPKPKLLRSKNTIHIVTFNIRTFSRVNQLPLLTASIAKHIIDIISIQEHRYYQRKPEKYHDTGNGWTFVSASVWKNSVNVIIGNIEMILSLHALKSQN